MTLLAYKYKEQENVFQNVTKLGINFFPSYTVFCYNLYNNKHLDWPANEVIPWHGTKSKMTANCLLNYRYRWSSNSKMLLNIFKNSHILTNLRPTCVYYKWAHLNQLIYAYIFLTRTNWFLNKKYLSDELYSSLHAVVKT